jgi:hypothetical protein
MKILIAYCWRCGTGFEVEVDEAEEKAGIVYDECSCGKSGGFSLMTKEEYQRVKEEKDGAIQESSR